MCVGFLKCPKQLWYDTCYLFGIKHELTCKSLGSALLNFFRYTPCVMLIILTCVTLFDFIVMAC